MSKWLVLFAAGCAQSGPHLISAMPSGVPRFTQITIVGERMCAGNCSTAGGEFVYSLAGFDTRLIVTGLYDTEAYATIPNTAALGTGTITLTVNGESSNEIPFEVTP